MYFLLFYFSFIVDYEFHWCLQKICSLRGWPAGHAKNKETHEAMLTIWEGLRSKADKDNDGQVSAIYLTTFVYVELFSYTTTVCWIERKTEQSKASQNFQHNLFSALIKRCAFENIFFIKRNSFAACFFVKWVLPMVHQTITQENFPC